MHPLAAQEKKKNKKEKKVYSKPTLSIFGKVAELTTVGSGKGGHAMEHSEGKTKRP